VGAGDGDNRPTRPHPVIRRRQIRRRLAAFLAVTMVALGLAACRPHSLTLPGDGPARSPRPTPTITGSLAPGTTGPFTTTGRGPVPPTSGAWFGVYAAPYNHTAAEKIKALDTFQTVIGRKVAIVHSFHPWSDAVPSDIDSRIIANGQIDLLSWAGTDTLSIASGAYDNLIEHTAVAIKNLGAPILLRFRWEMDRPNLASTVHSPEAYIAAWKHVRAIFTEEGATNAGFVWCPLATGFANGSAQQYYPGDDQVDWICADVYPPTPTTTFASMMAPVMQFAAKHPRPVIVGEFGVDPAPGDEQADWYDGMAQALQTQPQIKAVVYFSSGDLAFTANSTSKDFSAFRSLAQSRYLSDVPGP
jgi:beta-mannanase